MRRKAISLMVGLLFVGSVLVGSLALSGGSEGPDVKNLSLPEPVPSVGSGGLPESSGESAFFGSTEGQFSFPGPAPLSPGPPVIDQTFEGFGFDDNATENGGFVFIPPDPIGAAGKDRVIAVVNTMIEARNKGGGLEWRDSLFDFFSPLGGATLGTFTFDPKVTYDQYEDRFVVVTLERLNAFVNPDPLNGSRILVAVSKTGTPLSPTAADWDYLAIDSKVTIFVDFGPPSGILPIELWADYPGFEVDEEAIYVTANMFAFPPFGGFGGMRLWIVDKGAGSGGFYDGGAPAVSAALDPYAAVGFSFLASTTMPAKVFGAGGVPGGAGDIGTFLVSYSSLTDSVTEFAQIIRVDDPLGVGGGPFFTHQFVPVGSIEAVPPFVPLPDAPQLGTAALIEVNDSRALDAVWRNNRLWFTTTILPEAGPDAGETTAHWFKFNTSAVPGGFIGLEQQGNIGGEGIAADTTTFFPSVAVNGDGDAKFGFAASAETIYAGAFASGREAGDPPGTTRPAETVHAGEDHYIRTFGGPQNRWGDYSGISLDPSNDDFAWVFNQYADERGTAFGGEDGRWGTAWARCGFKECDPDPRTQGYWNRQCLGAGMITAGRNGRGPSEPLEPGFVGDLVPAVDARLQATVFEFRTCEDGIDANPPSDPCERALKQYTALLLNSESFRLQENCGVDLAALGCNAAHVGELITELAGLITSQDPDECKIAAECAGAVNEGGGIIVPAPATSSADAGSGDSGSVDTAADDPATSTVVDTVESAIQTGRTSSSPLEAGLEAAEPTVSPVTVPVVIAIQELEIESIEAVDKAVPKSLERHLAILGDRAASDEVRKASQGALFTALGGGYGPDRRLEIARALVSRVDLNLHSLLAKHLEDIRAEAEELGREDLAAEAEQLMKKLEPSRE